MTTRERILTLADGGHEPHIIAALLGLEVTDVAQTLALPSHTPSDPGGGASVNWCIVQIAQSPALTKAGSSYTYKAADLTIEKQSGTDFSIEEVGGPLGGGAIATASGGRFQSACYVGTPTNQVTLDNGSSQPRYLEFLLSMGPYETDDPTNPNIPFGLLGIDTLVPVIPVEPDYTGRGSLASTPVSCMGYCSPGKACCFGMGSILVNAFGTDSVAPNQIELHIWQV